MPQTPSIYVAHDASDLLNSLPTLFGFRIDESLVAVATSGERRRFGFRLRVDVPVPEHVDLEARRVVAHLRNAGADGAILIAVTTRQHVALDLLDAIHALLDETDVVLVARVRADGRHYWTDLPGEPDDGTAYETSDHHVSIVHAVAAGQQILPDRQSLVERFAAVAGERRRWLTHASESVLAEIVPVVTRSRPGELAAVAMAEVGPILARGRAGGRLSDSDLLRVAAWVSSIEVRDEVWGLIRRDDADDMLRVLTLVSGAVVPPLEPAVLSLTAFAAWLTGDGAQALIAVERALRADPDYSMARLVLEILEAGLSPTLWTAFVDGDASGGRDDEA